MLGLQSLQSFRTRFVTGACCVGVEVSFEFVSEAGFGVAKAFGEGDLAGADVVAAAACDAIEQAVAVDLIALEGLQVPMRLLWQLHCRAGA